ncbi:hypothetical protein UlMin_017924 [Ulmus minor]
MLLSNIFFCRLYTNLMLKQKGSCLEKQTKEISSPPVNTQKDIYEWLGHQDPLVTSPLIYSVFTRKKRVDESESLTLESIRHSLILQEDSIIFTVFSMDDFRGSLVEFIVRETEKLHAQVGRYKSPDEHPFFPEFLPESMLPPLNYPQVLHPSAGSINRNNKVWNMYFRDLLPRLVKLGDDGNCGLATLSKRIYYGKFVAEAKFRESLAEYEDAIRAQIQIFGLSFAPCICLYGCWL